ncbi:efflux RND transporter periplasmic adaptor subunit [Flavobacterium sp. NST-5]|uniref:Efflux RND transporter periplasmic adaptor subunit n=1 Tax=Flavobacterium ichthyis TaxID=2698827 RepID=A0ABW9Z4W6_9FLAO|nr:efflux RND transporter periplasmic adaptor subunit [Flavobacterium ichthyis]NBL63592.1 efflux RND transporter periplasmic adaptor subunit [Flavobacterium ichthyis]
MKFKHIIYTVLILGIGGLIAYRISSNKENKEKNAKGSGKKETVVSGIVAQKSEFADNLTLSGTLEANEQILVRSEVSGIVEQIFFNEGSQVSQGQILFKVNDVELRANLIQTKTAQTLASENERRAKLLLEKEAISREEYDIASADFKTAKAQTQLINAQLAKTSVRAPFSGTIGLRSISKGTYVTPETVVAQLVNTSQLKITFSVPEKYASQIKTGRKISFNVPGSAEKFSAEIYAIDPQIELSTRTLRVRAVAKNPQGKLYPGTYANVTLPLEKIEDAIFIPTEALIPIQNGKKLFIAENGKAKEIIVTTGSRTDKNILITSGLKPGDTVLTSGVMTVKNEMPVKVSIKK